MEVKRNECKLRVRRGFSVSKRINTGLKLSHRSLSDQNSQSLHGTHSQSLHGTS